MEHDTFIENRTYNSLLRIITIFHKETGGFSLHLVVTTHSPVLDCTVSVKMPTHAHVVKLVGMVECQKLGGASTPRPSVPTLLQ